ncbi:MAG: glycoside hydrolase family 3 C-terminal domain-containing protein [Bacteroidales bacterium]|nr:glycoside hydrolase family 3 C-terminal domain-containing protein [Candidatus Cryptobacteroides faecihippi]
MRKFFFAIAALTILASCSRTTLPYQDSSKPVDVRVRDLVSRMTLEEKIGQLLCPLGWPMYEKTSDSTVSVSSDYEKFIMESHGGMLWAVFRADPWTRKTIENGLNPVLAAKAYNELQKFAIENSRLGIPIIFAEEAPHGHMAIGTTVFPTSIGLASTWSRYTVEEVGHAIAAELRAQGGHISYGPVIDLSREPRWSRVEETYGEDVYLTSQMASGMIKGTSPKANGWDKGVISTLKHFVAYGIPEGGHNGNPSTVGERDLLENFLPTFKSAIDAGALSVMTSYNTIDGIPTTANHHLLTEVLKDEWNFDGFVVSDLYSVDGICGSHNIAKDAREAGEMALKAGLDVDLGANCFALLDSSVAEGRVSEKMIDKAVSRVLRIKFELGLFDNPYIDPDKATAVRSPEHVSVARKAAQESITLLENNGILPLSKDLKVAVIGPNADNVYNQLGDYTAPQDEGNVKTILDGIRAKIGSENVTYVKGCAIRDCSSDGIARAKAAAKAADVAVVVVGGSSARDFKTKYIETGAAVVDNETVGDIEAGEGSDRATLDLLGLQESLLRAVREAGKPMVVVYVEGRPLDKRWAKECADALLTAWYPGQEGGNAVADVLFGDYNPAGRLPVSVPVTVGQIPVNYNKKFPYGHDYVEMQAAPLYPFGYGLSYTAFEYSDIDISRTGAASAKVSVTVRNVGKMDGDEVVQLYVTDLQASTARPRKQLRGFERVRIAAGESVRVDFELDEDAFSLYNPEMKKVVEPGEFRIMVGASSEDIRQEGILVL